MRPYLLTVQLETKPPTEFDQTPPSRAVMQYIRAVAGWRDYCGILCNCTLTLLPVNLVIIFMSSQWFIFCELVLFIQLSILAKSV